MRNLRGHPGARPGRAGHRAGGARPDDRRDDSPRPERPRHVSRRRHCARRPQAEHRRRRGRPPAVLERDGDIWAVQNGELYNHDDLRATLAADGHRFDSRCDTEVLPHLYERWDTRFPKQLRGMFAIAIWDGRQRRAVLARDRLGIKPLYYADTGDLARLRVGAEEPARERPRVHRARLRGDRRLLDARLRAGATYSARAGQEAAARAPARRRGREGHVEAVLAVSAARARARLGRRSRSTRRACWRSWRHRSGCG